MKLEQSWNRIDLSMGPSSKISRYRRGEVMGIISSPAIVKSRKRKYSYNYYSLDKFLYKFSNDQTCFKFIIFKDRLANEEHR